MVGLQLFLPYTDVSLQGSPMKLECLTIGKLENSRKSTIKWQRYDQVINPHA